MNLRIAATLALLLATTAALPARADTFPSRPVKIVVPFSAGGTPDLAARLIAQKLSTAWKSPVLVDNRPGAGSTLGAEVVARSQPDGYTWLMASDGTMVINPAGGKTSYNVAKDFKPVTLVARVPFLLVVNAALPVHSVAELVQYAKARPGRLYYGSAGLGTPQHLGMAMLGHDAAIDISHVPYKGAAPAVTDLIAGRIQVFMGAPNSLVQHIKSGKLRAIATAGGQRAEDFKELPTIAETLPGVKMDVWMGLYVPAAVPDDIVAKIHKDVAAVLNEPDVKGSFAEKQFLEVSSSSADTLREIVRDGQARWVKVLRETGIKLDY